MGFLQFTTPPRAAPYNGRVGISLRPDRLKRCTDLAQILFKYCRADLVTRAGLDEVLHGERVADGDEDGPNPDGLRKITSITPLYGHPGFAMLFFLAAASGGIWLAVNILRSDRAPRRR
jgi:hypothetical protein